jgi:hypothetical protein
MSGDDDFFSISTTQGERILNVDNLGENRDLMRKVFSRLDPDHRRTVLSGMDAELARNTELSQLRHASKLHSLKRDLERRHRGLLRLGK